MNFEKICLVLSCRREYYTNRRTKCENTYKLLISNGFTIVFLYGDNSLTEPVLSKENDKYSLTVPVEDTYVNIPQKVFAGYKYFVDYNIKGILKIDDDTEIVDSRIFEFPFINTDYFGVSLATLHPPDNLAIQKGKPETFEIKEQIKYFGGPFYWISQNALRHIVNVGFKYPWEDVCVGSAIQKVNSFVVKYMPLFNQGLVRWSDETEK